MTRRTAIGLLGAARTLAGADPEPIQMFDGKTLSGWSVREGPPSAFYLEDGSIVIHEGSNFPAWLRYDRRFENFDFQCEFFVKGWSNAGIYVSAPEHGRPTWTGMKVNLFHKRDALMRPESVGAIFPVVAPLRVNVKNEGEWNPLQVRLDWPRLQIRMNDELIQDLNLDVTPQLRHRLRSGYIGIESLSYPVRFRGLRVTELPSKEPWQSLYSAPQDLKTNWRNIGNRGKWEAVGDVLRADGDGYLATADKYLDFELQCYIRGSQHHNGGIIFRGESTVSSEHYEIQLHDVEGAVYPTGSLYGLERAIYPRIEPEKWFPFQLIVKGRQCVVRVNGDTVVDYGNLDRNSAGPIMLQAHQAGRWIEYKEIKIKRL